MNDHLIRDMADKLGVGVEHIWGALLRQAPIDSIASLILWLATLIALALVAPRLRFDGRTDEECLKQLGMLAIAVVMALFLLISVAHSFGMVLAGLLNPDFWALKTVANLIK